VIKTLFIVFPSSQLLELSLARPSLELGEAVVAHHHAAVDRVVSVTRQSGVVLEQGLVMPMPALLNMTSNLR